MPYKGDKKREYQAVWRNKRRAMWIAQNGPCKSCGSMYKLEIDHIDRDTKDFKASSLWNRRAEVRMRELAKCQVLCYDCHKDKSIKESSIAEYHGTGAGWSNRKCRCDLCREYHRNAVAEYRSRTGKR